MFADTLEPRRQLDQPGKTAAQPRVIFHNRDPDLRSSFFGFGHFLTFHDDVSAAAPLPVASSGDRNRRNSTLSSTRVPIPLALLNSQRPPIAASRRFIFSSP